MSIARPVGAMSKYLAKLLSESYILVLEKPSKWLSPFQRLVKQLEAEDLEMLTGGTLFSELGFYYVAQ